MRYRALALPSPAANAVGPLELECFQDGLHIVYLSVRSQKPGYAPLPSAERYEKRFPWSAVHGVRLSGPHLYLELDSELGLHSRLLLSEIRPAEEQAVELNQRRTALKLSIGGVLVLFILLSLVLARRFSDGQLSWLPLLAGAALCLTLLLIGFGADRRLALVKVNAENCRAQLQEDILFNAPQALNSTPLRGAGSDNGWLDNLPELLPRTATAVAIALGAASLSAVMAYNWLGKETKAPGTEEHSRPLSTQDSNEFALLDEETPPQAEYPTPPPAEKKKETNQAATPRAGELLNQACHCAQPDSVLWRNRIPRLSPIVIDRLITRKKDRDFLSVELGVVNNGDTPLSDIEVHLQFFQRDGESRQALKERTLYYEGPLAPGKAVKWHVENKGNDFDWQISDLGSLAPEGGDAAPAGAFAELTQNANHRPVRLHGAMMLAFLGDERARTASMTLREALRDEEAPFLDRILGVLAPLIVCDVKIEKVGEQYSADACVFNRSPM